MIIKKGYQEIWNEYKDGQDFNSRIDLYRKVEENENFFLGRQWEGVNAPDLQKPVINVLKPTVSYYLSVICSDDIGTRLRAYADDEEAEHYLSIVSEEIDRTLENDGTRSKLRDVVRDAAVDGDGCLYWRFDPSIETGQIAAGEIRSEKVDNINVIFGDPYSADVQTQPYIILALRKPCCEVQDEARANGVAEWETIAPDMDSNQGEVEAMNGLTTVLIKLWKEQGQVHAIKSTETALVRSEWLPGGALYPVAWMNWDKVRKCYHGEAAITGMIQNQISTNKLFAMYIRSVETNAFPKIVYDRNKFKSGWSNRVGEAIGVNGNVLEAAVNVLRGGDVSPQVMDVIQNCINLTKESMGANASALGNVNAERAAASAIIANQQASAAPLELNKHAYYDFVEDCVRIILDQMGAFYGVRTVRTKKAETDAQTGQAQEKAVTERVDFGQIHKMVKHIEVSVGSSAYWSELMQTQTMDNLLQSGIITDAELYLEAVPDKWMPNKAKLIESVRKMKEEQAAAAGGQMPGGAGEQMPLPGEEPKQRGRAYYESLI